MTATALVASTRGGLTTAEATQRLQKFGPNELARDEGDSVVLIFLRQFKSPVVWLLFGAGVLSGLLGELADAIAIGAIVVLNAVVGFIQEYKAERAVQALRSMTAPRAMVRRDNAVVTLPATQVVPGDLLLLEAGDVVAADAKLLEVNRLATNEAALTGESAQVEKSLGPVPAKAPLAERFDSVFMGTSIANGTGVAEVVATGMRSELGRIAKLLATVEDTQTPLQQRLSKVSRLLLYACVGVVAVVAAAGLWRGIPRFDVFLSAVSLAVAAVPEGLPAVVTIALAMGVRRMAARHVLVRRLPAVESLGCATVICTDKTGTLTTGVMKVRQLWGKDELALLSTAAACCNAELAADGKSGVGDTTEVALLAAAAERGVRREDIERSNPRVSENPFDSVRKRMSVLRADAKLYVKGAGEAVLPLCVEGTQGAAEANAEMARQGLRVLAVALGTGPQEQGLRLLGLVGVADPPRPEVVEAVSVARDAGITTVMITGDHPLTAKAIAAELGIVAQGESHEGLVHARATPEEKLTIVRSWKANGAIVAMTGDGVNDAPALREAHIGICMGKTGTEVTREASDMVLADDNFASIVAAVREGRGIFNNIRKALSYLLSGNAAELTVMLIAALIGFPVPLLPLQMLWINLVTDGFPALALVMDPPEPDVMKHPPRPTDEPMLGRREWLRIAGSGALVAALTLGIFGWALGHRSEAEARTMAFATLVFTQILAAFAFRSPTRLFWEMGTFSNVLLLSVILGSVSVQWVLHHWAVTRALFRLAPLGDSDWGLVLAIGFMPVTVFEVWKLAVRWGARWKR